MAKFSCIFILISVIIFALQPANISAGPISYAICQSACNVGWVSCYASAGLVAEYKIEITASYQFWSYDRPTVTPMMQSVENWTYEKLIKIYRATSGQKYPKKVLDSTKKDLKKVKETNSEFDTTRPKESLITGNCDSWSTVTNSSFDTQASASCDFWSTVMKSSFDAFFSCAFMFFLYNVSCNSVFFKNWITMSGDTGIKFEFNQVLANGNTVSIDKINNHRLTEKRSRDNGDDGKDISNTELDEQGNDTEEDDAWYSY
ncbi:16144_t:CDS:2 [Funneliformis mosseae]|uniref:16144_t:CDS:1 n=1 Tax=Funneliformis mosseae TaxID=27381 RepID=A0A9N8ZJH0_FUNMO|nr:16144_t:CDS:2 [Funneliformis mosseae]